MTRRRIRISNCYFLYERLSGLRPAGRIPDARSARHGVCDRAINTQSDLYWMGWIEQAFSRGEDTTLTASSAITIRLRSYGKLLILLETLAEEALRFGLLRLRLGASLTLRDRARWLSRGSARILRRIGFVYRVLGAAPSNGLLVSNHLSHIDVLVCAAACQCIFVAKHEVSRWPVVGWFARWGGTVFVRRERPQDAVLAGRLIEAALRDGVPVMLFPEGTSTDGSALLPFHPFLFEPAVRMASPVTACAIGYTEHAVCYYGEVAFLPHLLSCLGLREVRATVASATPATYASRKEAAAETRRQVERLRMLMRE